MYILEEKLTSEFLSYLILGFIPKVKELLSQDNIYVGMPIYGCLCNSTRFENNVITKKLGIQDKNFSPENNFFLETWNGEEIPGFFKYWIFIHEQDAPEFANAEEAYAHIKNKLGEK